jgi:hypothetical protein
MSHLTKALPIALALYVTSHMPAFAWGDEGHEIIALIAQSFLTPAAADRSGI